MYEQKLPIPGLKSSWGPNETEAPTVVFYKARSPGKSVSFKTISLDVLTTVISRLEADSKELQAMNDQCKPLDSQSSSLYLHKFNHAIALFKAGFGLQQNDTGNTLKQK